MFALRLNPDDPILNGIETSIDYDGRGKQWVLFQNDDDFWAISDYFIKYHNRLVPVNFFIY
ncbi:MAG TPA: hypothetical protein VGD26_03415 [Chitinophagaceae bacterium]